MYIVKIVLVLGGVAVTGVIMTKVETRYADLAAKIITLQDAKALPTEDIKIEIENDKIDNENRENKSSLNMLESMKHQKKSEDEPKVKEVNDNDIDEIAISQLYSTLDKIYEDRGMSEVSGGDQDDYVRENSQRNEVDSRFKSFEDTYTPFTKQPSKYNKELVTMSNSENTLESTSKVKNKTDAGIKSGSDKQIDDTGNKDEIIHSESVVNPSVSFTENAGKRDSEIRTNSRGKLKSKLKDLRLKNSYLKYYTRNTIDADNDDVLWENFTKCYKNEITEPSHAVIKTEIKEYQIALMYFLMMTFVRVHKMTNHIVDADELRKDNTNLQEISKLVFGDRMAKIMSSYIGFINDNPILDFPTMVNLFNNLRMTSYAALDICDELTREDLSMYSYQGMTAGELCDITVKYITSAKSSTCNKVSIVQLYKKMTLPTTKADCMAEIRDYICGWYQAYKNTDEEISTLSISDISTIAVNDYCKDILSITRLNMGLGKHLNSKIKGMCNNRHIIDDDVVLLHDILPIKVLATD